MSKVMSPGFTGAPHNPCHCPVYHSSSWRVCTEDYTPVPMCRLLHQKKIGALGRSRDRSSLETWRRCDRPISLYSTHITFFSCPATIFEQTGCAGFSSVYSFAITTASLYITHPNISVLIFLYFPPFVFFLMFSWQSAVKTLQNPTNLPPSPLPFSIGPSYECDGMSWASWLAEIWQSWNGKHC